MPHDTAMSEPIDVLGQLKERFASRAGTTWAPCDLTLLRDAIARIEAGDAEIERLRAVLSTMQAAEGIGVVPESQIKIARPIPAAATPQPERWEVFTEPVTDLSGCYDAGAEPFAVHAGLLWFRRRVEQRA